MSCHTRPRDWYSADWLGGSIVQTMQVKLDEAKFVELFVHAVNALGGQERGMATKLNKILYFCDFAHIRRTGDPITGFEYQKLPQGPAPRAFVSVRDRLIAEGTISLRTTTDAFEYNHHIFSASRKADLSVFTESERQTVEAVVARISSMSAREVSDLSHEDAGWQMVALGESIPYASAYLGTEDHLPERLRTAIEDAASDIEEKLGPRLAR